MIDPTTGLTAKTLDDMLVALALEKRALVVDGHGKPIESIDWPPATSTVRLPLAPRDVTSADERFRCDTLHAVISGRECVARQGRAKSDGTQTKYFGFTGSSAPRDHAKCRKCADGQALAKRIGGAS